jgi:predicted O-methyltransferase YrrM
LGTAADSFRIIPEDHPLPGRAVSLLGEYLKMPDVHPKWMVGGGHRREWLCPIYGQSTEMELLDFLYFLIRLLKPRLVIEGGCHVGLGSYALGRGVQDNGHGEVITSDVDFECFKIATKRCEGLPVTVNCCSIFGLPLEQADFLYLDCDNPIGSKRPHDEIRLELLAKAKPGALVLMHDTRHEPHLAEGIAKTQHQFINFKQTWRGFSLIQL